MLDINKLPPLPIPLWTRQDGAVTCFRPLNENEQRIYRFQEALSRLPKSERITKFDDQFWYNRRRRGW